MLKKRKNEEERQKKDGASKGVQMAWQAGKNTVSCPYLTLPKNLLQQRLWDTHFGSL